MFIRWRTAWVGPVNPEFCCKWPLLVRMQRAENRFRQSAHCMVAKIAKENVFADIVSYSFVSDYYTSYIVVSGRFDVTIAYTKNDILLNGAMDERHCTGV